MAIADANQQDRTFDQQVVRNIERLLHLEHLTQKEVAAQMPDFNDHKFSKAQNLGRRWQLPELDDLARVVGVPVDVILARTDGEFNERYLRLSSCFSVVAGSDAPPLFDDDLTPWNALPLLTVTG